MICGAILVPLPNLNTELERFAVQRKVIVPCAFRFEHFVSESGMVSKIRNSTNSWKEFWTKNEAITAWDNPPNVVSTVFANQGLSLPRWLAYEAAFDVFVTYRAVARCRGERTWRTFEVVFVFIFFQKLTKEGFEQEYLCTLTWRFRKIGHAPRNWKPTRRKLFNMIDLKNFLEITRMWTANKSRKIKKRVSMFRKLLTNRSSRGARFQKEGYGALCPLRT